MNNEFSKERAKNVGNMTWLCDNNFADWILDILGVYGETILDVGCGNGFMLKYYKNKFMTAVGIDPCLFYDDASVLNGKAEDIPFEDNSFDICIAKSSLHHFEDVTLGLKEMSRVARKAVVVIEVIAPHNSCIPFLQELLLQKEKKRKSGTVFTESSLLKAIEVIKYRQLLSFHYDQLIDVETWLKNSDLSEETYNKCMTIINNSSVKNKMQIHYRNDRLVMIRRMCMTIALLSLASGNMNCQTVN